MENSEGPSGRSAEPSEPARYRIVVSGRLDPRWSDWFYGMTVTAKNTRQGAEPITVLSGEVADQSALRGLLDRVWNLNLTLLSVTRVDGDPDQQERTEE